MKKFFMLATVAFLFSGMAFAQEKKDCCKKSAKTECTKDAKNGKSCCTKEAKDAKTATKQGTSTTKKG